MPHGGGQWAPGSLLYTATLQWAVSSGDLAIKCHTAMVLVLHTAWGQWAVGLLLNTSSLPWGSGQWNSFCALPHRLGAVGNGTPAVHCRTALGGTPVHCLTASVV